VEEKTMSTIRDVVERHGLKKGFGRLRALLEMADEEDLGDVRLDDDDEESDFQDHLYNAFKSLQSHNPKLARKVLALLRVKEPEAPRPRRRPADDDTDVVPTQDLPESRQMPDPDSPEILDWLRTPGRLPGLLDPRHPRPPLPTDPKTLETWLRD
jgi:hypothetical protein